VSTDKSSIKKDTKDTYPAAANQSVMEFGGIHTVNHQSEKYDIPWKRRYTAPSGVSEYYCARHGSLAVHNECP
jgi:hypothetical protein